jgi:hypothetical protein
MNTLELKPGDRIKLVEMPNDPNPIEPGSTGMVEEVQRFGTDGSAVVYVNWDNGRGLNLSMPPDIVEVIG